MQNQRKQPSRHQRSCSDVDMVAVADAQEDLVATQLPSVPIAERKITVRRREAVATAAVAAAAAVVDEGDDDKPFVCIHCPKTFAYEPEADAHYAQEHWMCQYCVYRGPYRDRHKHWVTPHKGYDGVVRCVFCNLRAPDHKHFFSCQRRGKPCPNGCCDDPYIVSMLEPEEHQKTCPVEIARKAIDGLKHVFDGPFDKQRLTTETVKTASAQLFNLFLLVSKDSSWTGQKERQEDMSTQDVLAALAASGSQPSSPPPPVEYHNVMARSRDFSSTDRKSSGVGGAGGGGGGGGGGGASSSVSRC